MIFLLIAGHFILNQFPEVQPVWQEVKGQASRLYNSGVAKFGMAGMAVILVALGIALTSRR